MPNYPELGLLTGVKTGVRALWVYMDEYRLHDCVCRVSLDDCCCAVSLDYYVCTVRLDDHFLQHILRTHRSL